ncbi:hypothetical protein VI817_010128 [Penicillium citrinum]|nr:hypothetical protein VI817_010128 [Penicillium citrinum]
MRFGKVEYVSLGRIWLEREAKKEVKADDDEEEVQGSFGAPGDWAWWGTTCDGSIEIAICCYAASEDDRPKEDEK